MINNNENISFILKDTMVEGNDLLSLMDEFNKLDKNTNNSNSNDNQLHVYYNEKYTIPQLLRICEYYGFLKHVKTSKCKKGDIIDAILLYELNEQNNVIVAKRQQLWTSMEELVNDKFMKKYILWT